MGKIQVNQLEKADTLPFRCNIAYHLTNKYGSMCNLKKWDGYSSRKSMNPYTYAYYIIKNNIGKSFNLTYSYYLKQMNYYDKYNVFLNNFTNSRWSYYGLKPYIDNNGLIQINIKSKEKNPIITYSEDYKTELRHKITGDKRINFKEIYINKKDIYKYGPFKGKVFTRPVFSHLEYGANPNKLLPSYLRYKAQESDFENVIISGYKQVFESKNDPRYVRIIKERNKQLKIKHKLEKSKRWKISEQDFRRLLKEKELKEKQLNLIKIESHGFDVLTSFRKLKTN